MGSEMCIRDSLPPEHHGKPVIILPMIYVGDTAKGEEILAPLRTIAEPLADAVGPLPHGKLHLTHY